MVLDPFCGSGTVGVVAERFGCQFIGIDLSPAYLEMARKRIQSSMIPGMVQGEKNADFIEN
jgi:DNA modification methylase